MRIIIDIRDYRGEPMESKYWVWLNKDGTVSSMLQGDIRHVLRNNDLPEGSKITVTWEESK